MNETQKAILAEFERATERVASLPAWARPIITRQAPTGRVKPLPDDADGLRVPSVDVEGAA